MKADNIDELRKKYLTDVLVFVGMTNHGYGRGHVTSHIKPHLSQMLRQGYFTSFLTILLHFFCGIYN